MLNSKCQLGLNPKSSACLYLSYMATIGTRFRQLRTHYKLSGEQVGEYCDVSKSMISQWESGIHIPPTERLIRLKEKIEFSVDWLLFGTGCPPGEAEHLLTEPMVHICHRLESMTPEVQYKVSRMVDAFSDFPSNDGSSPVSSGGKRPGH